MALFDCTIIGDVFMDVIIKRLDTRFSYGGTTYCDFAKAVLGGSGNVAVGLARLGGKAAFIGKAGRDLFGKLYLQDLEQNKVTPKIFFEKSFPTGLVISFVEHEKERSLLVFRGANDNLSVAEVKKAISLLKKSKYVYFSGYSLIKNPQKSAILYAIKYAKRFRAKIVFDPGAYNIIKSDIRLFKNLLHLVDILSLNIEEAKAITNTTDIGDAIHWLRNKVPLTALKCGEDGSIFINGKNILRVPSYKVKCVDPTGAGDAFTAALVYGLTRQLSIETVSQLANWFAAKITTQMGSRKFPSNSQISRFLNRETAKTTSPTPIADI